jgi:hypothetical protein
MARTHIPLVVLDADGTLIESAGVEILDRGPDTPATVYTTEAGMTTQSQPLSTDTQGRINAWVDRGTYTLEVTPPGQGAPTIIEYWDSTPGADEGIDTDQLQDLTVTTAKIDDDAITNAKIADLAVDTENIVDSAVETAKIAPSAVTNARLNDGAVGTSKILDDSISAAKLKTDSVTTVKIQDEAITQAKIAPDVEATSVIDDAISTVKIQNYAVTVDKLANDSVDDSKLKDDPSVDANRAVTTNHIRDDAITNAKIASGAVTNTEVDAAAAIAYGKLALTGNIVNNDVKSNAAIAYSKLAALATGQILVGSGGSVPTPVTLSGDGTVDGSGVLTIGADKIDATKLKDDPSVDGNRAVTTDHIRDGAITGAKIDTYNGGAGSPISGANPVPDNSNIIPESIDTDDIADEAITSSKLAPGITIPPGGIAEDQITDYELSDSATIDNDRAVTTDHIRDSAVTTAKIADLNVTTGKLANDAVDANKLKDDVSVDANRAVTANHIRDAAVTNAKLAGSIAGAKLLDDAVDSTKLKDDPTVDGNRAVTTNHVRDSAITTAKINDLAVTSGKLAENSVILGKIATGAVDTDQILDDAVTSGQIDTDAVTSDGLADDASVDINRAVTTNHIRNLAVTAAKIANGTITFDQIQSGTIANAQINASADIAFTKLAPLNSGNILVGNASNDAASVAMSGDATISNAGVVSLATNAVGPTELEDNAVTELKIADGEVTKAKIASNDLDATTLADDAVTAAILRDDAVTDGNRAVTADHIRNKVIIREKIADNAVDTLQLETDAVENNQVLAGSLQLDRLATDPLARANHSGTQLHTTIDDFDTGVRTNRLNQMAIPTASVDMNSQKIIGLATPIDSGDAATKAYVDGNAQGLDLKASVRLATDGDITLSGSQTIDGVSAQVNDRVLVKDQNTASQNGIYDVQSGAWTRSEDMDENVEVSSGLFTFVEAGTVNADSGWVLTTDGTIDLETTPLTFTQFSGAGSITAGTGMSKSGNTLNVGATDTTVTVAADTIGVNLNSTGGLENSSGVRVKLDGATLTRGAAGIKVTDGLYQPIDNELTALAGLTSAANALPYFTGSGTASTTTLSAFGRSLIDDADAGTALATIGAAAASHTHVAANVTDFDTQVQTNRLDQMAAPTASVSMNSQRITGLATPTSSNDAARKSEVDALKTGYAWATPTGMGTASTVRSAAFDVDATTLNAVAEKLGQLIADLEDSGIIVSL